MASRPSLRSAHFSFLAMVLIAATVGDLPAGAEAETISWGLIGFGVGLPLLLFALWLLVGPVRGCDQLGREWTELQSQCEAIRESFDKAATDLEGTRGARVVIEEQIVATGSNGGIDEARAAERTAEESLANWRGQLDEATAKADAARRAFEQCLGKAAEGSSS